MRPFALLCRECSCTKTMAYTSSFAMWRVNGRLPFNPKFRTFRLVHQMERTISIWWFGPTGIFGTSFEGGPLWLVRLSRSVGRKCPFPFDKNVVPSTSFLCPSYKNYQTRGGLGRVCVTGMYRSIGHVKRSIPNANMADLSAGPGLVARKRG